MIVFGPKLMELLREATIGAERQRWREQIQRFSMPLIPIYQEPQGAVVFWEPCPDVSPVKLVAGETQYASQTIPIPEPREPSDEV